MAAKITSKIGRSARDIADSAVHIRIHPRPQNLAESRQVLRVLEQFGEVVMYRHLKHDLYNPLPNSAVALYQSAHSARDVINASPLRYEIRLGDKGWSSVITQATPWKDRERGEENSKGEEKEQATKPARDHARGAREESINDPPQTPPSPPTNDKDSSTDSPTKWGHFALERNNANHHLPAAANHSYPPPETPPKNDPAAEVENSLPPPSPAREEINNRPHTSPPPQAFELTVSPSQLNHQSYIERQGYFGPFSVDKKHVMADDLEKRVPLEGLIDCQLLKQQAPLRMRLKREKEPLRLSLTALRRPD